MVQNDQECVIFCCNRVSVTLCYLANIGIEVHHTVTELLHILGYQLVWVGNAVVQVANLIVCEPPVVRLLSNIQQCFSSEDLHLL